MLKSDLLQRLADQNPHLYARDVDRLVDTIFEEIEAALVRGDRVELRGFGAFSVKTWPARLARNPRSGGVVSVPEKRHPTFRIGKRMIARLNQAPS
jgi:integration host factor subunit beta